MRRIQSSGLILLSILFAILPTAARQPAHILVVEPFPADAVIKLPWIPKVAAFHNHTEPQPDDHPLVRGLEREIANAIQLGFDVFAPSNHIESTNPVTIDRTYQAAAGNRPGTKCVIVPSGEYTIGGLNPLAKDLASHINTFGTPWLVGTRYPFTQPRHPVRVAPNLDDLYRLIETEQPVGFGQLNHPWARGHFNDLALPTGQAYLRDFFALIELDSGMTSQQKDGLHWYEEAIRQGWRVAPTANNDTEGPLTARDRKQRSTGLWVDVSVWNHDPLGAVLDAIRARRATARLSSDWLLVWAEREGAFLPMGSRIQPDQASKLTLAVWAQPEAPQMFSQVTLRIHEVRKSGVTVWGVSCEPGVVQSRQLGGRCEVSPQPDTIAYFVVLVNGPFTTYSAPIWVDRTSVTKKSGQPFDNFPATMTPIRPQFSFGLAPGATLGTSIRILTQGAVAARLSRDGRVEVGDLFDGLERERYCASGSCYEPSNPKKRTEQIGLELYTRSPQGSWQPLRLVIFGQKDRPEFVEAFIRPDQLAPDVTIEFKHGQRRSAVH